MYTWHGRHYLGAAHGLAGIATLLLQLKTEQLPSPLAPTINYLTSLQLPSGNFPSSLESCHDSSHHSDRLIHWCHGAPGFIHLLSHAYQMLGEGRYLKAGEMCGEVVWKRGLLRKGYSLCHGAAGNAYTFIQLYHLTGHTHHWHRALKFAEWCLSCSERVTRTPDAPLSLFEGSAGVAFFYCDIIMSSRGKTPFPCLEIPQPKITFTCS
ncbi:LanC-like protein 2 [Geodia barretti]|nr:LanC-like protein 2 [Geodia barretti]